MKNIDRYDDEARLLSPDEETSEKQKRKRAAFWRHALFSQLSGLGLTRASIRVRAFTILA